MSQVSNLNFIQDLLSNQCLSATLHGPSKDKKDNLSSTSRRRIHVHCNSSEKYPFPPQSNIGKYTLVPINF